MVKLVHYTVYKLNKTHQFAYHLENSLLVLLLVLNIYIKGTITATILKGSMKSEPMSYSQELQLHIYIFILALVISNKQLEMTGVVKQLLAGSYNNDHP